MVILQLRVATSKINKIRLIRRGAGGGGGRGNLPYTHVPQHGGGREGILPYTHVPVAGEEWEGEGRDSFITFNAEPIYAFSINFFFLIIVLRI